MNHTLAQISTETDLHPAPADPSSSKTPPSRRVRSTTRPDSYVARLAVSDAVRDDAFDVRYRSYVAGGHIQPNAAERFRDNYDDIPNASTIVIYDGARAIASVRTCTLARGTDLTSPARDAFRDEVDALLAKDPSGPFSGRGIEVTRLVRSPEAENNQGLVFLLYRMAGYVALCAHSQVHLACVRSNHAPFYRRLGYEPASALKPYPGLSCPMMLMASDRARYDKVRQAVPAMDPLAGSTTNLDGFFKGEAMILSLKGA